MFDIVAAEEDANPVNDATVSALSDVSFVLFDNLVLGCVLLIAVFLLWVGICFVLDLVFDAGGLSAMLFLFLKREIQM